MFSTIRTSKENKEIISELTRRFDLKSENVIARIALAYSLENDSKLNLDDIKDSGGKEYNRKVLFGQYEDIYLGMVCVRYSINKESILLSKYIKGHLDKGLQKINDTNNLMQLLN